MKDYINHIDDEDTILFLADAVYTKAARLHKQAEVADARLEEILEEIRTRGLFDKWLMLYEHNEPTG